MKIDIKNAIELFQNGQIEMAQEICSEIKKKDPKNLINLNLIGIVLFQKKEFKESIEILENLPTENI